MCSAWSDSGVATLVSLREHVAKGVGADYRAKITVASFSADVSTVLGLGGVFPNMSYVVAVVSKRSQAGPQLVSRGVCAAHVFIAKESMCLRHGRRCSLVDCAPIDVLVADGAVDLHQLVAARSAPASFIGLVGSGQGG